MLKNTKFAKEASEKIGSLFRALPFHPTTYTLLSVLFALVGLASWISGFVIEAFALFILAMLIDAIDGAVARAKNLVSKKGAFLDGISDRLVEFFLLLCLMHSFSSNSGIAAGLVVILFFGTCMTSFVKAYAEHSGLLSNVDAKKLPGLLERAERVVLLMLVMVLVLLNQGTYAAYVIWITAFLAFVTFVQRVLTVARN